MQYKNIVVSAALLPNEALQQVSAALSEKGCCVRYADINEQELSSLKDALAVGTERDEAEKAAAAGIPFGLAVWQCHTVRHIRADYYFRQPYDILSLLTSIADPYKNMKWLKTAMEMQFIAQAGIEYTVNDFDRERFERLSEMAAQIMSDYTDMPVNKAYDLFCSEKGFQTPKLDTRAAIFKDEKILLVKERDGRWSLPGGWVDVDESICGNTVKEAREEAGLDVVPTRLVAVHDRNRHNTPLYAYGIIKVFMICEAAGGHFARNIETSASSYFALDELPPLSVGKNTREQIELCFAALHDEHWIPVVD